MPYTGDPRQLYGNRRKPQPPTYTIRNPQNVFAGGGRTQTTNGVTTAVMDNPDDVRAAAADYAFQQAIKTRKAGEKAASTYLQALYAKAHPQAGADGAGGAGGGGGFGGGGGGGVPGVDLSPFDLADAYTQQQSDAGQQAIAQGLQQLLARTDTQQADYNQQAAALGQRQKADLASVLAQSQAGADPVLADMRAQGVGTGGVEGIFAGNQDTLRTQGGLQDEFLKRNQQLMGDEFADTRGTGALIEQGAQSTRENNLMQALAQTAMARSQALASAANGGGGGGGGRGGGSYASKHVVTMSKEQAMDDFLTNWKGQGVGPRAADAFRALYAQAGGNPAKLMQLVMAPKHPDRYWKRQHLPGMVELVSGAAEALSRGDQKVYPY